MNEPDYSITSKQYDRLMCLFDEGGIKKTAQSLLALTYEVLYTIFELAILRTSMQSTHSHEVTHF